MKAIQSSSWPLACFVGAFTLASVSFGQTPPKPQLVFASDRTGRLQLWKVQPDPLGTPAQLTFAGSGNQESRAPDRSRFGKIAYHFGASGAHGIHAIDAGGGNDQRLTISGTDERDPSWSPDGRFIVYASNESGNYDLWIHDSTALPPDYQLLSITKDQVRPAWSPDGKWIAYVSNENTDNEIMVVPVTIESGRVVAGSPVAKTSNSENDFNPCWSPDSLHIAFQSTRGGNTDIYRMDLASGEASIMRLTTHTGSDSNPSWSPDGSTIAFVSDRDGNSEIYVMSATLGEADAVSFKRITNDGSQDVDPAWDATPPAPDLAAKTLSWKVAQGRVEFAYDLLDADLTVDTTAELYWAADPNYLGLIGSSVRSTTIQRARGTHGPVFVAPPDPTIRPPNARYLVLVLDPPSPLYPRGLVEETDDLDNNLKAVPIPEPLAVSTLDPDTLVASAEVHPAILRWSGHGPQMWQRHQLLLRITGPREAWIRLFIAPLVGSGGHNHADSPRKHGWLLLPSENWGTFPPDGFTSAGSLNHGQYESVQNFRVQIGADGKCDAYYIAPEICGYEDIFASTEAEDPANRVLVGARVIVRVPGLVELAESGTMQLKGMRCAHPQNHFGTPDMRAALSALAANYFAERAARLGVNDMSLSLGGVFDIGPGVCAGEKTYGEFWENPHVGHRVGTEVDIDLIANPRDSQFELNLRRQGWWIDDPALWVSEKTHYHLMLSLERGRVTIEPAATVVNGWNPGTRIMDLTVTLENRGGLEASTATITDLGTQPAMPLQQPNLPLELGALPIRDERQVAVRVTVPEGLRSFYLLVLGVATAPERSHVFPMPDQSFGTRLVMTVQVPTTEQGPMLRTPKGDNDGWEIRFTSPSQETAVGANLVFDGVIRNFTGADLFITNLYLYLQTPAPKGAYVVDYAPEFLAAGGYVPPSGYSGPIITLRWLDAPPVGSVSLGTLQLSTDAAVAKPTVAATFLSPFQLQKLEITTVTNSVVISWPASGTNMVLHLASDIVDAEWLRVDQQPVQVGDRRVVTLPATDAMLFYRLFAP